MACGGLSAECLPLPSGPATEDIVGSVMAVHRSIPGRVILLRFVISPKTDVIVSPFSLELADLRCWCGYTD